MSHWARIRQISADFSLSTTFYINAVSRRAWIYFHKLSKSVQSAVKFHRFHVIWNYTDGDTVLCSDSSSNQEVLLPYSVNGELWNLCWTSIGLKWQYSTKMALLGGLEFSNLRRKWHYMDCDFSAMASEVALWEINPICHHMVPFDKMTTMICGSGAWKLVI